MTERGDSRMTINWRRLATIALTAMAALLASAGTLAVTAAGFTLSFDAIRAVGVAAHIRADWAWMLPVSVDGAMATATVVAIVLYKMTGRHRVYPWLVLATGVAVSMASNALHSTGQVGQALAITDGRVRAAVATIPAVMLALSFHLLATLVTIVSERVATPGQSGLARLGDVLDTMVTGQKVESGQWVNPEQVARRGWPDAAAVANGQSPGTPPVASEEDVAISEDVFRKAFGGISAAEAMAKNARAMTEAQEELSRAYASVGDEASDWLSRLADHPDLDTTSTPPAPLPQRERTRPAKYDKAAAKAMIDRELVAGTATPDIDAHVAHEFGISERTARRLRAEVAGTPVSGPPDDSAEDGEN